MWISRIRVTGGFLNGIDVSLSDGLNVVVGPRGVGKTTFLELLRHAVGAEHADQGAAAARERQAFLNAILGTGEVVVDIQSDDGGRRVVVDARGGGQRPDLSRSVLVLGQNELEEIASDAPSRLHLLDLRTGTSTELPDGADVELLTGELFDIRTELAERKEESAKRSLLLQDRDLLVSQETALLGGSSAQLSEQREALRRAEERVITTGQELDRVESTKRAIDESLSGFHREADRLASIANRSAATGLDSAVLTPLQDASNLSIRLIETLTAASGGLIAASQAIIGRNIAAREAAAPIRESLEKAEAGLGQITSQLRNVDTQLRSLDENDEIAQTLESRLRTVSMMRGKLFDATEIVEEDLYKTRAEVARSTTAQIANNVVVVVDHLADTSALKALLQEALRGSNTRNSLIDQVAERVLPRQLLELVEGGDTAGLAAVAGIPAERARKLLDYLDNRTTLQSLAGIRLHDSVDFRLRDGSVDKSVDELSTGQKCAVTLPIVLSEKERTLILDQPEDHLDNAFLVQNIVTGLNGRRSNGAQTIVATHNANIPVLGSADNVIVLSSDGMTGSVDVQGTFDSDPIVDKITRLMEGGRDAFARRFAFYRKHGGLS